MFVVRRKKSTTTYLHSLLSPKEFCRYTKFEDELKNEGCTKGGYKLKASDGSDFPMCCRHLFRDLRMFTVYASDGDIWITHVDQHNASSNPHAEIAERFPALASIGRRRADKPPCCLDPLDPPVVSDKTRVFLEHVVDGIRSGARVRRE